MGIAEKLQHTIKSALGLSALSNPSPLIPVPTTGQLFGKQELPLEPLSLGDIGSGSTDYTKSGLSIIRQPLVAQDTTVAGPTVQIDAWNWASSVTPQTDFNYAKAIGDPIANSAIAACMNWIVRTFPEAPLTVLKRDQHRVYHQQLEHDMTYLVENPNPYPSYSDIVLWGGTLISYTFSGNAYWLKVRNEVDKVVELYYIPHFCITPRWPIDGSKYISHYEYRPGDGSIHTLESRDIVHFRFGTDPRNDRLGLSQIGSLLREIFTDNEANNFSASLLKNMGVPGIIISPASENATIKPETAQKIKKSFSEAFTRDHRGEPMVMSGSIKVSPVSLNPQQLDLKLLHRLPEERISAVLGIPAIVAGLGAGLERSTMANFKEAREMAFESNIIPTMRVMARTLKRQLLVDFEPDTKKFKVDFDLDAVRVLQSDKNVQYQSLDIGVRGGWIKRSEARAAVNLPVEPEDEVYLTGGNGGLDEFGQPVPGLMTDVALNNAEKIRAAQGLSRPSGATQLNRVSQPQGQRNPQRGYHGRFINTGNQDDNNSNNDGTAGPNKKKPTKKDYENLVIINTGDLKSLSKFLPEEVILSKKSWADSVPNEYCYLLEPKLNPTSHAFGTAKYSIGTQESLNIVLNNASIEIDLLSDDLPDNTESTQESLGKESSLLAWELGVHLVLKKCHLVAAAASSGGWSNLTSEKLSALETVIFKQFESLRTLITEISSSNKPLNDSLVAISQTYPQAAWGTYFSLS